jgi:hypothetical protein
MANDIIDNLATILYSDAENINRANAYVKSRGLDPARLKFPWMASGSVTTPFESLKELGEFPIVFTECAYVPIVEIDSPLDAPVLAGFDVRYIGDAPNRLRWSKRKRAKHSELIYNIHAILKGEPVILTESAMDSESARLLGWEAISTLNAVASPKLCHFLYACGVDVFLAYDNDDAGKNATAKILKILEVYPKAAKRFRVLSYPYKDLNAALQKMGASSLKNRLQSQLCAPNI